MTAPESLKSERKFPLLLRFLIAGIHYLELVQESVRLQR
jgi:hypothetical protein